MIDTISGRGRTSNHVIIKSLIVDTLPSWFPVATGHHVEKYLVIREAQLNKSSHATSLQNKPSHQQLHTAPAATRHVKSVLHHQQQHQLFEMLENILLTNPHSVKVRVRVAREMSEAFVPLLGIMQGDLPECNPACLRPPPRPYPKQSTATLSVKLSLQHQHLRSPTTQMQSLPTLPLSPSTPHSPACTIEPKYADNIT